MENHDSAYFALAGGVAVGSQRSVKFGTVFSFYTLQPFDQTPQALNSHSNIRLEMLERIVKIFVVRGTRGIVEIIIQIHFHMARHLANDLCVQFREFLQKSSCDAVEEVDAILELGARQYQIQIRQRGKVAVSELYHPTPVQPGARLDSCLNIPKIRKFQEVAPKISNLRIEGAFQTPKIRLQLNFHKLAMSPLARAISFLHRNYGCCGSSDRGETSKEGLEVIYRVPPRVTRNNIFFQAGLPENDQNGNADDSHRDQRTSNPSSVLSHSLCPSSRYFGEWHKRALSASRGRAK